MTDRGNSSARLATGGKAGIEAVARAEAFLAPLGVETSDLRSWIDDAIRNAFRRDSK